MEPLQTNLDLEEGYCKALLCRLRFRKVLSCVDSLMFCNYLGYCLCIIYDRMYMSA